MRNAISRINDFPIFAEVNTVFVGGKSNFASGIDQLIDISSAILPEGVEPIFICRNAIDGNKRIVDLEVSGGNQIILLLFRPQIGINGEVDFIKVFNDGIGGKGVIA